MGYRMHDTMQSRLRAFRQHAELHKRSFDTTDVHLLGANSSTQDNEKDSSTDNDKYFSSDNNSSSDKYKSSSDSILQQNNSSSDNDKDYGEAAQHQQRFGSYAKNKDRQGSC